MVGPKTILEGVIVELVVGLIVALGGFAVEPLRERWLDWTHEGSDEVTLPTQERETVAPAIVPPKEKVVEPPPNPEPPRPPKQGKPNASVEPLGGGPIMGLNGQTFADSYKFRCTDNKGVQGEFRAAIFLHQYNWEFGADGVQLAGASQSFDSILREEGLREALGSARELISIGTASCEGGKEGEEERAGNRAANLSAKIRNIIKPPQSAPVIHAYHVNLGQFLPMETDGVALCDGRNTAKTRSQRKIIVVAIDRNNNELDLRWCLAQILAKCPDLDRYSNFDNFKLAW